MRTLLFLYLVALLVTAARGGEPLASDDRCPPEEPVSASLVVPTDYIRFDENCVGTVQGRTHAEAEVRPPDNGPGSQTDFFTDQFALGEFGFSSSGSARVSASDSGTVSGSCGGTSTARLNVPTNWTIAASNSYIKFTASTSHDYHKLTVDLEGCSPLHPFPFQDVSTRHEIGAPVLTVDVPFFLAEVIQFTASDCGLIRTDAITASPGLSYLYDGSTSAQWKIYADPDADCDPDGNPVHAPAALVAGPNSGLIGLPSAPFELQPGAYVVRFEYWRETETSIGGGEGELTAVVADSFFIRLDADDL